MHKFFKRNWLFIFCAIFLLFLTGCGGTSSSEKISTPSTDINNPDYGRIQGTVTASSTGNIIVGAIVETFQAQAVTASDGRYLLGPLPAGDYRLITRATGYSPVVKDAVRVLPGKITENQNFAMSTSAASYDPEFAIVAVLPNLGTDGDVISIFCRGCGTRAGKVTFNGKEAQILDWNSLRDDKITVSVPAEVETGPVKVIIDGQQSKETQDQLFTAKPVILSAQPSIARGGQNITLYGRNFNLISQFNKVRLTGTLCTTVSVSNSKTMQIQLPQVAKTGTLSIRIESNEFQLDGFSSVVVTITPELVYLSPKRSVPGVPLTVYGYNFGSDKNIVKVLFGSKTITPSEFISFSDTSLSFNVPDNSILPAGQTAEVIVQVNESKSNALGYTAYNTVNNTLTEYGVHRFEDVSSGGTLHLATLKPTDRIVFLSVLTGYYDQNVSGNHAYSFSSFLGGNFEQVPNLPASIREKVVNESDLNVRFSGIPGKNFANIRASLTEPASETLEVYLRDFTTASPFNSANDILATGTIKASDSVSILYVDVKASGIDTDQALEITQRFNGIYNTVATACVDADTNNGRPEGNVDSQERIALFVSPTLDQTSGAEQMASYFDARDKDATQTNSAGTEILYLNSETFSSNKNDFYGGLAQTLSYMIYFHQKGNAGTDWLAHGLSTFARQVAGYGFVQGDTRALNWVSQYLQYPEEVALDQWPENPQYYNYGMVYLFIQYLFDRCGAYNAISKLETNNGSAGLEDVENNIVRTSLADPSSLSLKEFFNDFCLALFCDDLGLPETFGYYNKDKHQFKSIQLRGKFSGVDGLKGLALNENPVYSNPISIKGYGCRMIEYPRGNWGDLEVTINSTPTAGEFKTWVIFYSTQ